MININNLNNKSRNILKIISYAYNKIFNKHNTIEQLPSKFDIVMQMAKEIKARNPDALRHLIFALGRTYQSNRISEIFLSQYQGKDTIDVIPSTLLFDGYKPITLDGRHLINLVEEIIIPKTRDLQLSSDLILPWPWEPYRAISAFSEIGTGCIAGAWQQDPNHRIHYWYPMCIGWVIGGNHSLAAGIIKGEGAITSYKTYDVSEVYNHVRCNGENYINMHTGEIIEKVKNIEFACIFEIGRLIIH